MPWSFLGTSILATFLVGRYHSWIVLCQRSKALFLEGFQATWVGAEVVGDSETDMEIEADMGSTIEMGGT